MKAAEVPARRVAVVTGGSRGIGRAICIRLAKAGYDIALNYAGNAAAAEETANTCREAGGTVITVQADVSTVAGCDALIEAVKNQFGRVDVLVNNAGVTRDCLLMRLSEEDYDKVLNTNLKGAVFCCKAVSRLMMKQRYGRIINMSSIVGLRGNAGQVNRKYAAKPKTENKILTQNVAIGLGGHKHRRNLNTLVCGGSGAGKTRFYAKPNIMNANTSFVCLDPKGELLRDTGNLLKRKGYDIKVIDLINMEKSHCYNPFVYLKTDNDVQKLATNLFKNTTPKGSTSQDPFWDQAAMMLLLALMFYLHYEAPEDEQNFLMVMEMIRAGEVREDDEAFQSPLDILFRKLEMKNPEHIALKYYKAYHSGSGKTLKSIQITLISRLEKFNLTSLAGITQTDELDLAQVGEKKTAIYAVIPDNDASFNFIVGMLHTQLFSAAILSGGCGSRRCFACPCAFCHGRICQCCLAGRIR